LPIILCTFSARSAENVHNENGGYRSAEGAVPQLRKS
jgi:hypothetical protein